MTEGTQGYFPGHSVIQVRSRLLQNGFPPVPITSPDPADPKAGKRPVLRDWRKVCASATFETLQEWERLMPHCRNTGILCLGAAAADIDVLNEQVAQEIVQLAFEILGHTDLRRTGKAPKTLLLYRVDRNFAKIQTREVVISDNTKAKVEILAHGQQFVGFGIHPETGNPYKWDGKSPLDLRLTDVAEASEAQFREFIGAAEAALIRAGATEHPRNHRGASPNSKYSLNSVGQQLSKINSEALANIGAWAPRLFPNGKVGANGAFRVSSKSLGRNLEEDLSIHPNGIRDFGEEVGKSPLDLVREYGGCRNLGQAAEKLSAWLGNTEARFDKDANGKIVSGNQENIRCAIAALGATVSFDEFQGRMLIKGLQNAGPLLDDRAMERLWLAIDERFGFRPSKDFFWTVVQDFAHQNRVHPVRDYLDSLRWDGKPRLETWLHDYAGADDSAYTKAVGRIVMTAAVRRIRSPGCKFDEMLVLESPQGAEKSTALGVLAVSPEWFSDDLPLNAESKKVIESLSGRWIVEAAELKGMRKGEVEHLKAFLSRQVDRARMSYDRVPSEIPRQCVFIGTTNSERYLRDVSGNRRFWPVRISGFDLAKLREDRDQLWGEAAQLEYNGVSIRLDPTLYAAADAVQTERLIHDPFTDAIAERLGEMNGKILNRDVWELLEKRTGQRTQEDNNRLGEAMRANGWHRTHRRIDGVTSIVYVRGTTEEQERRIFVLLDLNGRPYVSLDNSAAIAPGHPM